MKDYENKKDLIEHDVVDIDDVEDTDEVIEPEVVEDSYDTLFDNDYSFGGGFGGG